MLDDIAGHQFSDEIVWLAEQGIARGCAAYAYCPAGPVTRGCAAYAYCPAGPVTRAQMASLLARALDLEAPQQQAGFADVDPASVHSANIEALHAAQITAGCSQQPLRYCPDDPVTRAQMAAFLYRARHLIAAAGSP